MEAIVPAFVAVFLSEFGGVSQRGALAMRAHGKGLLLPFLLLALTMAVAATGGFFVAPVMPIQARGLLVGLALISAAIPLFIPSHRKPASPSKMRFGMALLGAGGPFVVFALAARTGMPHFAALGGLLGGIAVMLPHMLTETPLRQVIPIGLIRRVSGGVLLVFGLIVALSALGLI